MGKPLTLETRKAIIRMIRKGDCSKADIARAFKIGHRSVQRYWSHYCQTGEVGSHAKFGGHKKPILAGYEKHLVSVLKMHSAITLDELILWLETQGVIVARSALSNSLRRIGYRKENGFWKKT